MSNEAECVHTDLGRHGCNLHAAGRKHIRVGSLKWGSQTLVLDLPGCGLPLNADTSLAQICQQSHDYKAMVYLEIGSKNETPTE